MVPPPMKTVLLMNGFPINCPKHRRFQTKLQIAGDLFERIPNEALILEQASRESVCSSCNELSGRECFFRA